MPDERIPKVEFAQRLRDNPTLWEKWLWKKLKNGLFGHKFYRQHIVAGYITDFCCPTLGLAVELDGRGHDVHRDAQRDLNISSAGMTVMRFANPRSQVELNDVYAKVYAESRYRRTRSTKAGFHISTTSTRATSYASRSSREKRREKQETAVHAVSVENTSEVPPNPNEGTELSIPQETNKNSHRCGKQE